MCADSGVESKSRLTYRGSEIVAYNVQSLGDILSPLCFKDAAISQSRQTDHML